MLLSGFAVFAAALLHEDIAILTASFFVAQRELPLATALAFLFAGVMINNLAIYGLGALARRLPGARRGLIGKRVERIGRELKARAVPAVLFCRLTPGLLLLTFIGCGRFGVPFFFRFAPAAAGAAAVYVSAMLTVVVLLGEVVLRRMSEGAWIVFAAIAVIAIVVARRHLRKAWARGG